VLAGLAALLSACAPAGDVIVDRFEVEIHLMPNGVAEIAETITVRGDGGALPSFERVVRPARVEGLEFASASIDGAPVPPAAMAVDAGAERMLRVAWRFTGATDAVHTIGLRYRARGVLGVLGRRGQFEWPALPRDRGYPILAARVDVTVPEDVLRLGDWGLAEAGWQVAELPNGVSAVRAVVPAAEGATVLAEVAVDPATMTEPRWQHDAELGRQLTPAFISGGLFILTIGVGIIWIIWFQNRSQRVARRTADGGERRRTAEGLYTAGVVCLAFGGLVAVATSVMLGRYGVWSMAIPGSILLVGGLFVVLGKRSWPSVPRAAGPLGADRN